MGVVGCVGWPARARPWQGCPWLRKASLVGPVPDLVVGLYHPSYIRLCNTCLAACALLCWNQNTSFCSKHMMLTVWPGNTPGIPRPSRPVSHCQRPLELLGNMWTSKCPMQRPHHRYQHSTIRIHPKTAHVACPEGRNQTILDQPTPDNNSIAALLSTNARHRSTAKWQAQGGSVWCPPLQSQHSWSGNAAHTTEVRGYKCVLQDGGCPLRL